MRKKFSIYLDEDLKIILESIGEIECRSLSQTIEYACKRYADEVTNNTPVTPLKITKKKEVKEVKQSIPNELEQSVCDLSL